MLRPNEKRIPLLSLILAMALLSSAYAAPQTDTSRSIFRFQQTMAEKGQAAAQYKLAMMYETGNGVEQNLDLARAWYGRAAQQQHKPASHRLTYLDIRQFGVKPAHQSWLNELQRDADSKDGEAMFLLGQMQADGIGLPRNLELAARHLRQAAAANVPGSEPELARVEAALTEAREIERNRQLAAELKTRQQTEKQSIAREEKQRLLRQKQLAEQQRQREARAIAEQQRLLENKYQQPPARQTALVTEQMTRLQREAEYVSEPDLSPCSGRNRFAATCR